MRGLISVFFLSFIFVTADGQNCKIPNGRFEEWTDVSLDIDSTGQLPTETIFLPDNFFALDRLLSANFDQPLGHITNVELAQAYYGIERSDDASTGQYALKLAGNELHPLSDLAATFTCDGRLPDNLYIDLKHEGVGRDTLDFYVTFGKTPVIPWNLTDLFRTSGFVLGQAIANVSTEWSTLTLPITDNEIGISADSVFVWLIVSSDTLSAMTEESYFLIDNLSFDKSTKTLSQTLSEPVDIYPMPFKNHITIDNDNDKLAAKLYDSSGQLCYSFEVPAGHSRHDLSYIISSGLYILELWNKKNNERTNHSLIKE